MLWKQSLQKQLLISFLAIACLGVPALGVSAALGLQSYSPQKHFRFYTGVDKDFIGAPFDSSGIGRSVTNNGWATMVSEHYFVTANHARPFTGNSNPLRFYQTNDPNGPFEDHVYSVDPLDGVQIGSDLWLGRLNTAPSAVIARYPILSLPNPEDYDNVEVYVYGRDAGGNGDTTSMRLGRNNINPGSVSSATDGIMTFNFDNPGLGADESIVNDGDSGGPTLAVVNGQFALVGLHWFKSSTSSSDTFVPRWITELNAALAVRGEQLTTVTIPEPATLGMIALGAAILSLKRRRP